MEIGLGNNTAYEGCRYVFCGCSINFLHRSKNISIASVFIDMHDAIDLLNLNMEMLPVPVVLESVLFGSAL